MSTIQDNKEVWGLSNDIIKTKYEKCLNITEEIYKRINITFEIKKLETGTQSELSDHCDEIDSNDLSNATDLFACDKSDISSTEPENKGKLTTCEKYININNNEEKIKSAMYKKPKKRFRKRVKKRQTNQHTDSECSSDEAVPLSRIVDIDKNKSGEEMSKSDSPDVVMGVPKIVIITKDMKPKIKTLEKSEISPEKKQSSKEKTSQPIGKVNSTDNEHLQHLSVIKTVDTNISVTQCSICSLNFKGERRMRIRQEGTVIALLCYTWMLADKEKNYKGARSSNSSLEHLRKGSRACRLGVGRHPPSSRRHMSMSHTISEETNRKCKNELKPSNPA